MEEEQTLLHHLKLGPVSRLDGPGGSTWMVAAGKTELTSVSAVCEISTGEQVEAFSTLYPSIVRSNQIMQHVDNYGKPQMQNLT